MRRWLALAALLLSATAALAWTHGNGGGGCSNSLVFTATCNSQYFGVMLP